MLTGGVALVPGMHQALEAALASATAPLNGVFFSALTELLDARRDCDLLGTWLRHLDREARLAGGTVVVPPTIAEKLITQQNADAPQT